ncbi:lysosomal alpha-mannosidase-like isoform X2 [Bacillus rossius redtenbacheri]|uniref:lysosomal alpha-mannosidase-like isoform X2 n=1 Tax=Bacillus rossius redtenbacheri TaxID=93214 RepID=UPI002FDEDCCA
MLRMTNFMAYTFVCTVIFMYAGTPVTTISPNPPPPVKTCGYKSCPKLDPAKLNVHLIAHSHDDVGWLKTVDQYYYGSHTSTQNAGVQYILDSVIQELRRNPDRRFIYVETAFFWKWWGEMHDMLRHQVRNLVNSGQLEFIGGAWSMNDEATTHYQSIVDQFTWGLRKLNDTFGSCGRPHVGWQIDPFGHSREMASLFAQLGYDGLLFGRLDYQDKQHRFMTKTAEMVWEASPNLGKAADLFTSVLYNNYAPPPGFCFDIMCSDEPIIDDERSPEYNVPQRVNEFVSYAAKQAVSYTTNHIAVTMGEDFNYQDAHTWFNNLDRLVKYVNQREDSGLNVVYSTPSCYLKALNDANLTWPTKDDDFFPYASDPHSYWTGYFTSRPTLKRFERVGNNFLQVCKQLYALSDLGPEDKVDLNAMREAMGVMQHHDAVTGTEKQAVAQDYARILHLGIVECDIIANAAFNKLLSHSGPGAPRRDDPVEFYSCMLLNVSQCEPTEGQDSFVVTVYNPLSQAASPYIRLPVTGKAYSVKDPDKKEQRSQVVPIPDAVQSIPGRFSQATNELVFRAVNLPPMGYRSYFVSPSSSTARDPQVFVRDGETVTIGKRVRVVLNATTGLAAMQVGDLPLHQDFYYYAGFQGNNEEFVNRSSGAYIFRPKGSDPIRVAAKVQSKVYKGPLVDEIHQVFSDWVSQVIRVYKEENHVELVWQVGPIPINDSESKEVISRFSIDLATNGTFYTDSNGRELLERRRDARPTWQLNMSEPVSANYYPVTSRILIRDPARNVEVAVLTDRAQGGSSLREGQMELMLHRRLLHDDAFGVGEALNETAFGKGLVARGTHYVIGGAVSGGSPSLTALERELAQRKLLEPWIFISPAKKLRFRQWASRHRMEFSGLTKGLPSNVHVLTLEPWKGRSLLVRLEHILEQTDDSVLSKPVTVNLQDLFSPFTIVSARETTLGANQWLEDLDRLSWKKESNDINADYKEERQHWKPPVVTLSPMQIRTFIVDIHFH